MSMGTPIDRAGSGGFGATRRDGTEGSLAADKGGGWTETILGNAEGAECNTDWKASLARHAWSILCTTLYHASGSVSVGRLYSIVAIVNAQPETSLKFHY